MMETIKERKCQVITKPLLHIIFRNTGLDLYAQGVNWFMALLFIIFFYLDAFSLNNQYQLLWLYLLLVFHIDNIEAEMLPFIIP